jgi:hypothetical protein
VLDERLSEYEVRRSEAEGFLAGAGIAVSSFSALSTLSLRLAARKIWFSCFWFVSCFTTGGSTHLGVGVGDGFE